MTKSNQFGSHRHQDCSHSRDSHQRQNHSHSWEYVDRDSDSPKEWRPCNAAMDALSRALCTVAQSSFLDDIERALMPIRFAHPSFNSYDGKMDPVEYVSHYIQMISLHTHNDTLMCKVFPSSLGPTILRWFNGLWKGSIHSFAELIQEFDVQFVTYSRIPHSVDALLSVKLRVRETICSYVSWY